MKLMKTRWADLAASVIAAAIIGWMIPAIAQPQSRLVPPQCAGKSGALLDQCVRDLTEPTGAERFEPAERKINPNAMINCNTANRADQGFCIARNEIIAECRNVSKHPDFQACTNQLITRPQAPRVADCSKEETARRSLCFKRNKVFDECLREPWLYFVCLGEKMAAK
jgi:hypothetical protein